MKQIRRVATFGKKPAATSRAVHMGASGLFVADPVHYFLRQSRVGSQYFGWCNVCLEVAQAV